ncbi:uncharacterized protein LOC132554841 [Ylistrum balloti]|uniref:uncharacterized protein LOC132554841 n=1 Tax=Ylistrum balloti TaxID=509963 RepID=UPI0029059279|nr:uncharacterized protein LOC132554841 [Ylistrum balloti]
MSDKTSDSQNIELVLHMVNKMCGELVDKGLEYFLVTADSTKALNIGSTKGRQFLQSNKDVVQRFIKHCYSSKATVSGQGQGEASKTKPIELTATPKSVGLTATSKPVGANDTPKPVATNATPKPVATNVTPKAVEANATPKPVGSNATPKPVGANATPKLVRVNATPKPVESVATPKPVVTANLKLMPLDKQISPSKEVRLETNDGSSCKQSSQQEREGDETVPSDILTAVNLSAASFKVKKQVAASKSAQTELKMEDPPCSPTEDTAETGESGETSSLFGMSLRAKRKRKIFADCEMSPLMSGRHSLKNELKTTTIKSEKKAKVDKVEGTNARSCKNSQTSNEEKTSGKTKEVKSDGGISKSLSVKLGPTGDKQTELKKCSVQLSHTSLIRRRAAKSVCSSVKQISAESTTKRGRSEEQDKNITTDDTQQTVHSSSDDNSAEISVKGESEPVKQDAEISLNLECSVKEDSDNDNYNDDESDEFKTDVQMKAPTKKTSTLSVKKSVLRKRSKFATPKGYNYSCSICEKKFKGSGALARHTIVHAKQCVACEKEFPDHESLLVHRKKCQSIRTTNKLYPCDKCDLVCIAPWSLRRHQLASHEWRCRYCKKTHNSEESLDEHMEKCIDKAVRESEQRDRRMNSQRQVCDTCGKEFANKGILMSHMRCHTEDVSLLISQICDVDLDQVDKIVDDVGGESKEDSQGTKEVASPSKHKKPGVVKKPYVCQHCEKSFKLRCELNKHARNSHPETYCMRSLYRNERDLGKRLQCQYCNRTSYNQTWMKVHTEQHVNKGDLKLESKEETTENDVAVTEEVNKSRSEANESEVAEPEVIGSEVIKSEVMGIKPEKSGSTESDGEFDTSSEVKGPLLSEDGNVLLSSLRCNICNISFKNKHELYSHAVSHRVFKCDNCGKILSSAGSLKKHLLIAHSSERNFMCEWCGKSFKTQRCVQQHIGKVHENPNSRKNVENPGPYVCSVCDKEFDTKRLLTKHKYYHKDRTTACPVCEKCFTGKGEMLYHLKHVHSDARNYVCQICQKSYKTNSSLREHRKQHHEGRESWRHHCDYCSKIFNKRSQLIYHMKVHTGDKPFPCDHCGLTFSQKGNLYKHLQTVHIRKVEYRCELCGKGFYLKENYRLHMRTHAVENGTAAIIGNKYGVISHCTTCNRYFPRKCSYKAHLLMHRQEWKYSCPICKKKFVTVTSCTRHLKTHLKCRMTSQEIREKFPLKIGAAQISDKYSHLISQSKTEGSEDEIEENKESKSIIIKKAMAKPVTPEKIKVGKNNFKKMMKNDSEIKMVSPMKSMTRDEGEASLALESLATGVIIEESPDITYNLVPVLDDAPHTAVESIIDTASTSKTDESVIGVPATSLAVESILDNVNNVMHLEDRLVIEDTAASTEENAENTEMSPSELNEILQTVNSQDFLQQLGSGNIILVQQGDTKAYVMLNAKSDYKLEKKTEEGPSQTPQLPDLCRKLDDTSGDGMINLEQSITEDTLISKENTDCSVGCVDFSDPSCHTSTHIKPSTLEVRSDKMSMPQSTPISPSNTSDVSGEGRGTEDWKIPEVPTNTDQLTSDVSGEGGGSENWKIPEVPTNTDQPTSHVSGDDGGSENWKIPEVPTNTDQPLSTALNKRVIMETMGLTEKQKKTEETPVRRNARSGGKKGEPLKTPSPARKSSRNCSTPVWLDLIPKRKKSIETRLDLSCIKIEPEEVDSKRGKNAKTAQQSERTSDDQHTLKGNMKSSDRLKRKNLEGDQDGTPTKKSKMSRSSKTNDSTTITTDTEMHVTLRQLSETHTPDEEASETPRQRRLSKRLTLKSEEKATPPQTPRQRRLSKTSKCDGETGPSVTSKPDQISEALVLEHDEESLTKGSEKETGDPNVTPKQCRISKRLESKKKATVTPETESTCDLCGKVYSTPQNMRRHRITHSDFKAYKCTFCSQRFHYIQYLREHVVGCLNNPQRVKYRNHDRMRPSPVMMKHLSIVPSPDEPDTFINLPFSQMSDKLSEVNAEDDIKNLTAENTEEEILEVLNKVKASQPEVNLQEARRKHREATKEFRAGINSKDWMTEDGQFKCNVCNKIILNQYNLYRHLQTHTESKRYKCTFCGRRFAVGQYLKDHVISCVKNINRVTTATNRRQIDPEVKRKIIILPSTVEEGTFVNAEMGDNLEDVDVEHEKDDMSTERDCELDLVKNEENGDDNSKEGSKQLLDDDGNDTEEVYKCSVREWNNYYAHRSYDGTGRSTFKLSPHLISVFKKEKELGDERLKNKVATPYHCTVCNLKKFNRAETLRRHLFTHTGDSHKCEICGMTFLYQEYLKSHVLELHFAIKRKRKSRSIKQFTSQLKSPVSDGNDVVSADSQSESSDHVTNETNNSDDKVHSSDDKVHTSDDTAHSSDDKVHTSDGKVHSSDDKVHNSDEKAHSSDDQALKCENCGNVFLVESRFNVHKLVCHKKHGNRKAKILGCKKDRKSVGKLQNFQKRILFQCVDCRNKFFKYENLLWHQFSCHGLASFRKCPVCSVAIDKGSLLTHILTYHPQRQIKTRSDEQSTPQYNFKCNQCDKTFTKELTMLIHQQKHMANRQTDLDKSNQCPVCKVKFTTFGNMRRHFNVIHSDAKPFMCHLCGKSFKTNDTLKCHVKIHNREKYLNFKCKTCGKGFFRKRLLKDHETLHIPGATTCMCDICGKRFRLKPNLSKHMNSVHNMERNHVCATCGKTFKLKEQLRNHMRYHVIKEGKVGEVGNKYGKIYKCDTCGKFCPSSYSLKIHNTSHSSERPYGCEICDRRFKVKSKLMRHVQNVHNLSGKTRRPKKQAERKQGMMHSVKEKGWSSQDDENIAESIVEVIVNSEAELMENTKMYSLLDHSYRPSSSVTPSSSLTHNDQTVIEEAVKGITQLAGNNTETDYIIQDVQEVEDQPGMYIVSSDIQEEDGNETQTFSLSVDEGPKTLIYYITTD